MQMGFYEALMFTIGEDFFWWMIPTHPELRTNYFERVWSKKEMKRMAQEEKFDKRQDDSDPDKKMFSVEVRRARYEKKLFMIVLIGSIYAWFAYGQKWITSSKYDSRGEMININS